MLVSRFEWNENRRLWIRRRHWVDGRSNSIQFVFTSKIQQFRNHIHTPHHIRPFYLCPTSLNEAFHNIEILQNGRRYVLTLWHFPTLYTYTALRTCQWCKFLRWQRLFYQWHSIVWKERNAKVDAKSLLMMLKPLLVIEHYLINTDHIATYNGIQESSILVPWRQSKWFSARQGDAQIPGVKKKSCESPIVSYRASVTASCCFQWFSASCSNRW